MGGIEPLTYEWSPATGLSAADIPNPVASPLTSTIYHVSVTDANNTTQVSMVAVNVNQVADIPVAPTTFQTSFCQGTISTLASTSLVSGAITYSWNLSPMSAGYANGSGTSAWLNWNANFAGLATVTVKSVNACGQSLPSAPLEITVMQNNCPPDSLDNICLTHPAIILEGGSPAGGVYSGTGVNGSNFDPSVAGTGTWLITYSYTDNNGCSNYDTKPIYVDPCAGIGDLDTEAQDFCYPNPTTGLLVINLNDNTLSLVAVRITNSMGELVKELKSITVPDGEITLDLRGQPDGIYFVLLETQNTVINQKVIVQSK